MRGQPIRLGFRRARSDQFRMGLSLALAQHQGLGLSQGVGPQIGRGRLIAGAADDDEFDRDDLRPLMQLLEEGVLAVGARLSEDHRAGLAADRRSVAAHLLDVRFHFQLLQEGGQAAQGMGVGRHAARPTMQAVDIVDLDQGQQHRRVSLKRRFEEMAVHFGGAVQKRLKRLPPQGDDAG